MSEETTHQVAWRRTKIVATIGPASREPHVLEELIRAGMNVARLNFSHGTHALHAENIARIRAAAMHVGRPVAILADLQGPKLRVGQLPDEGVPLEPGETVVLTPFPERVQSPHTVIPVQYKDLPRAVEPGDRILLDDGMLEMRVLDCDEETVTAEVVIGGTLKSRKGLNLPRTTLNISAITEKDRRDLLFVLEQQVDWVALSFVRTADEVYELKEIIRRSSPFGRPVPVIAKIEKPEALENLDAIIEAADGVMVARGDLAIETSSEMVPLVQKDIIRRCNRVGKPVITATQMLESMIHNPRPTRAEASDVANAILDGTDAVMLSAETAAGKYPVQAVEMMARIARETEQVLLGEGSRYYGHTTHKGRYAIAEAVAHASVSTAVELGATAIITPTMSGSTARQVAKYRPPQIIVATTPNPNVQRQLVLFWGVYPLLSRRTENTDEMINNAVNIALEGRFVEEGDVVVLTAGTAGSPPGSTDLMKVQYIRRVLVRGQGIGHQVVTGRVRRLESPVDPHLLVDASDIIVTSKTDRSFIDVAQRAAGLISEQEGMNTHSAILAIELGLPAVVGAKDATKILQDGQIVTIDARQGVVYEGD
nr:pyruvate kinase [Ardenticatena sp.]